MLEQEELFWWQKSREECWVEGENNTKYFHSRIVSRRKRQMVYQLNNEIGVWTNDKGSLQAMAR